jgi:hypothetical protein
MRMACDHGAHVHAGVRVTRSSGRCRCTQRSGDFIAFFIGESRGAPYRHLPADDASRTASGHAPRPRIGVS